MAAGIASGRIGTTGARSGSSAVDIGFTTPEASDLHRLFAAMLLDGVESVAMEVSSHALALGRVEDVEFAAAAFTNLSQDHLDFHGSMEDYFAAKRELFFRAPTAVINIGDTWGERLAGQAPSSLDIMTVGLGGDLSARDVVSTIDGSTFTWLHGGSAGTARVPLAGSFNVENALVATGLALVMGLTPGAIEAGLAACPPVPGRFEVVRGERGTIVVDYAHTPEAIAKTVAAARQLTTGRLVAVFGAGGDRDRDKRPLMGAAACAADLAILTNDNPRSEDPEAIAEQVRAGMTGACDVVVELDRRAAIELAVGRANPGDTVLLLGKGHEPGQAFADHTEPFDDRAEAARVLEVVG